MKDKNGTDIYHLFSGHFFLLFPIVGLEMSLGMNEHVIIIRKKQNFSLVATEIRHIHKVK